MTRGYLWTDLQGEIEELFLSFSGHIDPGEIADQGFAVGSLYKFREFWRKIWGLEDRDLPPDLLQRLRQRRREVVNTGRRELCPLGRPATATERKKAVQMRRASEGKCYDCENPRVLGKTRCKTHLARQKRKP